MIVLSQILLGGISTQVQSTESGIVLKRDNHFNTICAKRNTKFIQPGQFRYSTTLLKKAMTSGNVLLIKDIEEIKDPSKSIQDHNMKSVLISPVMTSSDCYGGLVLWRDISIPYTDDDMNWISNITLMLAGTLEKEKLKKEIQMSHEKNK